MYNKPINIGPGPTNPETDFSQSYVFTWKRGTTFAIETTFNTTWVSYIYLFDADTHEVMFEFTNDDGGATQWQAGVNLKDTDLQYGILNYHKYQVSPGHESAGDEFLQGTLAKKQIQNTGKGEAVTIGFSDGHSRDDNALAIIQIAGGPV